MVAGYGRGPWLAIRDLTKLARITARDTAADGDRFEVIRVTGSVTMTEARSRSLLAWSPSGTTSMFQPPGVR